MTSIHTTHTLLDKKFITLLKPHNDLPSFLFSSSHISFGNSGLTIKTFNQFVDVTVIQAILMSARDTSKHFVILLDILILTDLINHTSCDTLASVWMRTTLFAHKTNATWNVIKNNDHPLPPEIENQLFCASFRQKKLRMRLMYSID